jgi:hypothetical protein
MFLSGKAKCLVKTHENTNDRTSVADPAPDSDPPIIMKNSKKNLDSYCFMTPFDHLSLKNDVNLGYLQKVIGRKTFFKLVFCWHLEG